MAANLVALSGL